MSEEKVRDSKFWLKYLLLPIVVGGVIAIIYGLVNQPVQSREVIYVNPPVNEYNAAYNPFLGVWRDDNPSPYGYVQAIIEKDENNLVWVELFDKCIEENCSLGRTSAELVDPNLYANFRSENRSEDVKMSFAGVDLSVKIDFDKFNSDGSRSSGQIVTIMKRVDTVK